MQTSPTMGMLICAVTSPERKRRAWGPLGCGFRCLGLCGCCGGAGRFLKVRYRGCGRGAFLVCREHVCKQGLDRVHAHGLADERIHAHIAGPLAGFCKHVCGQGNDGYLGKLRPLANLLGGLESIHDRHMQIHQHQVWQLFLNLKTGLFSVFCKSWVVPHADEQRSMYFRLTIWSSATRTSSPVSSGWNGVGSSLGCVAVLGGLASCMGSVTVNVLPWPSALWTVMSPPCAEPGCEKFPAPGLFPETPGCACISLGEPLE